MNGKINITLVLIVSLVTFVIGILIGGEFVAPQLGPTDPSVAIRANSCGRDDTCKVNSLLAGGRTGVIVNERGISTPSGSFNYLFLDSDGGSTVIDDSLTVKERTFLDSETRVNASLSVIGPLSINGYTTINGARINDKLELQGFGYSNASANYVCVSNGGFVFIKSTPCR